MDRVECPYCKGYCTRQYLPKHLLEAHTEQVQQYKARTKWTNEIWETSNIGRQQAQATTQARTHTPAAERLERLRQTQQTEQRKTLLPTPNIPPQPDLYPRPLTPPHTPIRQLRKPTHTYTEQNPATKPKTVHKETQTHNLTQKNASTQTPTPQNHTQATQITTLDKPTATQEQATQTPRHILPPPPPDCKRRHLPDSLTVPELELIRDALTEYIEDLLDEDNDDDTNSVIIEEI